MMHKLLTSIVLLLLLSPIALAQEQDNEKDIRPDACRTDVEQALAKEQRMYRSVLFGQRPAEQERISTVRYDSEGTPWIKTDPNTWKSVEQEEDSDGMIQESLTEQSDSEMNNRRELEDRRGIFETRGVLTSEIIPPLTQAVRALGCRIDLVCATAVQSISSTEPFEIVIPGCIDTDAIRDPYQSCQLEEGKDTTHAEADVLSYCNSIGQEMLLREMSLLQAAVQLDASTRSLYQFAGYFDQFLIGWRHSLSSTFNEVLRLLSSFSRIPCFTGSCDASPPPENAS